MCVLKTIYEECDCVKTTKLTLCPGVQHINNCLQAQCPVEHLPAAGSNCRDFTATHHQDTILQQRIASIHEQSRAKYQEFKNIYQGMLMAMARQRKEEVDRLAATLARLEIHHRVNVEILTTDLQELSIHQRQRLDERTAAMICDTVVREMEAQERADRVAVEELIAQARQLEAMAKENL